jgi:DNA polymerase beta
MNHQIISILERLHKQYQSDSSLRFKTRALRNALSEIKKHNYEITSSEYAVKKIKSIGNGIASRIDEILKTGTLSELKIDNTNISIMDELLTITGIGPTRANQLVKDGITGINDLKKQVSDGKIKITHHIQIGLDYYVDLTKRIPRNEITLMKKVLQKEIKYVDSKLLFEICGSYRRGVPDSGDIDVLISHSKHLDNISKQKYLQKLVKRLKETGFILDSLTSDGAKKYMGVCRIDSSPYGRRIDIRCVDFSAYYAALLYFTGSKNFNILVRNRALELGYSLNEYSLTKKEDNKKIILNSEKELFEILDIDYIKPTERNI